MTFGFVDPARCSVGSSGLRIRLYTGLTLVGFGLDYVRAVALLLPSPKQLAADVQHLGSAAAGVARNPKPKPTLTQGGGGVGRSHAVCTSINTQPPTNFQTNGRRSGGGLHRDP